jgi:hypothetical protein
LPPQRRPEALVRDLLLIPRASSSSFNWDRAEFGIAAKNRPNDLHLAVDDDELAVLRLIGERRHTAHPHPLLYRGGDLVADAFADDLALELREGQQHIQDQAPHRGRRVKLLRDRNEYTDADVFAAHGVAFR